jgi:hypothetical protein
VLTGHPRRPTLALLAAGCGLPLLVPSASSASSLVVRDGGDTPVLRPISARHDQVSPRLAVVTRRRSAVHPSADGAFLPVLLFLVLSSAVMVIQLVSSPPGWIKG